MEGMPAETPEMAGTLHNRIRGEIEARILSGEWAPGRRLPFEHELMRHYGCARMTVSKAMTALAESGLIERRRRAGSFVRAPASQSALLHIPDIKAEIEGLGKSYAFRVLSRKARAPLASEKAQLDPTPPARILALDVVHFAQSVPFALEKRLIALEAVPEAETQLFAHEPPGSWLLHHVAWHEAEHCISAEPALGRIADILRLAAGSACLVVERKTWRSGVLLTAVKLWYPGEAQKLVARFTPASGAAR